MTLVTDQEARPWLKVGLDRGVTVQVWDADVVEGFLEDVGGMTKMLRWKTLLWKMGLRTTA